MAKRKGDIFIGKRAWEEVIRLFPTFQSAAKALGCDRKAFNAWLAGCSPSSLFLARLHYFGGDVIYILTGKRGTEDG